jgi:hypothetical protein
MSVLEQIKDLLTQGPNNWRERLQKTIVLVSPEGNEFEAKWRGSPRSLEKKLGIFSYPKIKGNIVQDLSVNSDIYPLTFFFDGVNADLDSKAFMGAARQDGPWTITHPTRGFVELQLIRATENDEPVESGGIYEINTEWIEPLDPETLVTARELAGIIDAQANQLNLSAIDQFINAIDDTNEALQNNIDAAVNVVTNASDIVLGPIAATVDAIDSAFNAIQAGIQATLNETVLEAKGLGGQIQQLTQLPLLAVNDIAQRLDLWDDLSDEFITNLPSGNKPKDKNRIAVYELALVSCVTSYARIITTGILGSTAGGATRFPIQTRAQAVETAEKLSAFLEKVTDALDGMQSNFIGTDIDLQYFSQSGSFNDAALITAQAVKYLLISLYDLKIEKRFKLEKPRAPIEITVTEYGTLGEDDIFLDLFIVSNELKGRDIMLLPPGREVVVYV